MKISERSFCYDITKILPGDMKQTIIYSKHLVGIVILSPVFQKRIPATEIFAVEERFEFLGNQPVAGKNNKTNNKSVSEMFLHTTKGMIHLNNAVAHHSTGACP